jgi:hypothetical protein
MSWNIQKPGDYINGPLTVMGNVTVGGTGTTNKFRINTAVIAGGDIQLRRGAFIGFSNAADTSNSEYIYANGGALEFGIGASTAAYLTSNGFGLGASPAHPLYLFKNQSATTFVGIENQQNNAAGGAGVSLAAYGGTWDVSALHSATYVNPLVFRFNSAEKARLTTLGAFVLAGGNTTNNGVGIAFPAAQSASTDANTLDDYEEGTWTGTIKGSVSDPTTPVTATGRYTKIGRVVNVQISFVSVNTTGASGDISVDGLPFTVQGQPVTASAGMGDILNYTGTLTSAVNAGGVTIYLVSQISASYATLATHKAGVAKNLQITMTYTV